MSTGNNSSHEGQMGTAGERVRQRGGLTVEQWLLHGDGTSANRGLNQEQQAAVTCCHNTVAAAGAGAGKTFVLARRYAYLVCVKKYKVAEILTLTFTRKATAEMYSRIYQTLAEVAETFDCAEARQAVADFHSARIQTLDSYCSSIIRNSASHYGIKPDFAIDDQQARSMASRMALPFVLRHRHNPAIQLMATTAFSRLDILAEELFARTITSHSNIATPPDFVGMAEEQLNHAAAKFQQLAADMEELVHDLAQMVQDYGKTSSKFLPKLQAAIDLFRKEQQDLSFLSPKAAECTATARPAPILASAEKDSIIAFCRAAQVLASLSLTGQRNDKPWPAVIRHIKESLYPDLAALANQLCLQQELRELAQLLNEFQEQYNKGKRQAGVLTFADAAQLALETLKAQPEIRQEEKEAYKAIMIDEFQDDNSLQKELLYLLAERLDCSTVGTVPVENLDQGKLFFVGDEKQSIYKFRGADVSVFRRLAKELAGESQQGAALSLSYNYRSHPTLIKAFNTIFGGLPYNPDHQERRVHPEAIFMEDAESTPDYEATYRRVLAGKSEEEAAPGEAAPRRVHLCLHKKEEEPDQERLHASHCEAYFVAKKIRQLVDGGRNPADIAILFATTTKQHLYEQYLKSFNLTYTAEATVGFFQDAPTNDILSFLTLCLYPANQTAYSTLLRSPLVGVSKAGLEILMSHGSKRIFDEADSRLLPSPQEATAFIQGCRTYHQLAGQAPTMPITQLVTRLWYHLGYRYKTMEQDTALQYAPLYDKLFHLAAQADENGTSLAAFVQSLQEQVDNKGKFDDISVPLEQEDGIQLMTIHRSKGLEFPVVFLVNSNGKPKANKNDASVYHHSQWGITMNLPSLPQLEGKTSTSNYFYQLAKEEETKKDRAELRRLLYVALTRAEEEVYITACIDSLEKDMPGKLKPSDSGNTMFKLLIPQINSHLVLEDQISVAPGSPFDAEWIPSVSLQDVQGTGSLARTPPPQELAQILDSFYQGEPTMPAVEPSPYRSPSHLAPRSPEHWQQEAAPNATTKPAAPGGAYSEIARLVDSSSKADGTPAFTYAHFGSCVHLYLDAALKNRQPVIPTEYLQHLHRTNHDRLHQLCTSMTQQFLASPTGQAVREASWRKSEYAFKYRLGDYILNGSIDLIYRDGNAPEERYHIVDYKSDQEERPEHYYVQQAAYRKAAAAILNVAEERISCSLYYLRSGNLVDITEPCSKVNLEELADLAESSARYSG